MIISEGSIPMTEAELSALDELLNDHPDGPVSFTRRDAGESGPLLVTIGSDIYTLEAE